MVNPIIFFIAKMTHSSLNRFSLTLLAFFIGALSSLAYDITGRLVDSNGEPMIQASVRLLTPKDSVQVKGSVTNENGRFTLSSVQNGSYILEASYVGYNPEYSNIKVSDSDIRLKPITLTESSIIIIIEPTSRASSKLYISSSLGGATDHLS